MLRHLLTAALVMFIIVALAVPAVAAVGTTQIYDKHLTIKCVDLCGNPIPSVTVTVTKTEENIIFPFDVRHVDYVAVTDREGKANILLAWVFPYTLTALSYVAEHPAYATAAGTIDPLTLDTGQVVTITMYALEG